MFVSEQAMKAVEQTTRRPFGEVFEEQLRSDPQTLPHLQRLLAERQQCTIKRDRHEYFDEAWVNRDAAEDRWRALTDKIAGVEFRRCPSWKIEDRVACAELPKLPGTRVAELIAFAELHAGCHHMGHNPKAWATSAVDALRHHIRPGQLPRDGSSLENFDTAEELFWHIFPDWRRTGL